MVRALRFWLALWTALILSPAFANEHVGGGVTQISPVPSWVTPGAANGTDLNFGAGLYWLKGAAGVLQDKRSTPATAFDANGNLVQFPAYVPAIAGGKIRVDETRTNAVRCNQPNLCGAVVGTTRTISGVTGLSRTASSSAVLLCSTCNAAANDLITISGASVGTYNGTWLVTAATANTSITFTTATSTTDSATGEIVSAVSHGTDPTYWTVAGPSNGISSAIISVNTQFGQSCIVYNIAGIPTALTGFSFAFEGTSFVAAYGQTWTDSAMMSASNLTGVNAGSTGFTFYQLNSSLGGLSQIGLNNTVLPATLTRLSYSGTLLNPLTAYMFPQYQFAFNSGQTINLNFTICDPQTELNSLPASVASAVVAAGGSGGTNGTNVNLTVTGGTCTTQPVIQGTIAGNALTAITGYGTPGACSVLPPSPATVTGNSLAGATVTLTPPNNAASAFPTPPIPTSGSAVTRNQSQPYINVQACPNPSLLVVGESDAPTTNPNQNFLASLTNAGETAAMTLYRAAGATYFTAGGSFPGPNIAWPAGSVFKLSAWANGTTFKTIVNNASTGSGTNTALGALNILSIGNDYLYGGNALNGTISRAVLTCGTSLLSASNAPANDNSRRWAWTGEATPTQEPRVAMFRTARYA